MRYLSVTAASVLQAIADGTVYGFDIIERTGLPSGTVYPALSRLERDGSGREGLASRGRPLPRPAAGDAASGAVEVVMPGVPERIVRAVAPLVPHDARVDWRREWEAELAFGRSRGLPERWLTARALGGRAAVLRMVIGQAMALAVLGLGTGLALAAAASGAIRGLLFGVEPLDTLTYVAAGVGFGTVALVASTFPEFRAARINLVEALRAQ